MSNINTPPSSPLSRLAKKPKEKVHWALKLLESKGHELGSLRRDADGSQSYEIDGKWLAIQRVYKLAEKYPEWNDRLGLGTAKIPRVSK